MAQLPANPMAYLATGVSKPPGTLLGIGLTCPSPELAQICGHAGFDVVVIDMEHGPISVESAYRMVMALAGTPAEAWIRVTSNDQGLIKLALDSGAQGIVSRWSRRAPRLKPPSPPPSILPRAYGAGAHSGRSINGARACSSTPAANAETRVTVLIEHPRTIENLDAIPDVEGLGGAIAAPFDLAVNMGFSDGPGHPEVRDAVAAASQKIARKGFRVASFAVTPEQGREAIAAGCQLLVLGFDVMFVPAAVQLYLRHLSGQPGV